MMMNYKQYTETKQKFFQRHDSDFQTTTSPMDQYGVYYKTYCFADGAIWYERMAPVWRDVEMAGEFGGVQIKETKSVKFLETEFFNTDNATSNKYYEKF